MRREYSGWVLPDEPRLERFVGAVEALTPGEWGLLDARAARIAAGPLASIRRARLIGQLMRGTSFPPIVATSVALGVEMLSRAGVKWRPQVAAPDPADLPPEIQAYFARMSARLDRVLGAAQRAPGGLRAGPAMIALLFAHEALSFAELPADAVKALYEYVEPVIPLASMAAPRLLLAPGRKAAV